jgi:hypothetical protein
MHVEVSGTVTVADETHTAVRVDEASEQSLVGRTVLLLPTGRSSSLRRTAFQEGDSVTITGDIVNHDENEVVIRVREYSRSRLRVFFGRKGMP